MTDLGQTIAIADIIRTPASLGAYLAPMLWGPGSTYQLDPWLAYGQRKILNGIVDTDRESFIMFNCPPQIGKSSFSGEFLPFWVLGMFPETRIIFITYSDDFSATRGARVRNMVQTWGMELFGIQVDPEVSSKSEWKLLGHRGGMLSVGIEGAINGKPGDLVVIDDVIKDAGQASSAADKRKHWDIYEGTIHARLQPGGTMLITATRWVEDDISGRIQAKMREPGYDGDPWQVISLAAIAEPGEEDDLDPGIEWRDELGRVEGEPLQCRFSKPGESWQDNHWYRKRRAIDPFTFSCVFQQEPTVRKGGMFPRDNWRWYSVGEEPDLDYVIRVWDLAATEGGGDWTVGLKMGKAGSGHAYIPEGDYVHLDVQRFRKNAADVQATVVAIARADGYGVPIKIERERSGSGSAILDFYEKALPFCRLTAAKADGKKENRATPYSAMQNLKRVWLPTYAPLDASVDDRERERNAPDWVRILVAEHRAFMGDGRTGRHDDTVDCGAYAVLEMLDVGPTTVYEPPFTEDWSRVEEMASAASRPRW